MVRSFRHFFVLEPCATQHRARRGSRGSSGSRAARARTHCCLVLPADHLVDDEQAFAATVRDALQPATQDALVTFGIPPTYPETGFGYIERGAPIPALAGFQIARFTESPWPTLRHEWSIRAASCGTRACSVFAPRHCWRSWPCMPPRSSKALGAAGKRVQIRTTARTCLRICSPELPDISIDYAVMEKSARGAVVAGGVRLERS